ncbi:MAG: hypothetical protein GY755_04490 [Chloroflexi bacterium]|nr:hypothetical protein [Chloroflexota bacterium]
MTDHKNIGEAILAVMQSVSYVQKEKKQGVNYSIKSEEGVLNVVRPSMIANGIVMYPVDVKDVNHSTFEAGKYKNVWNRIVATHVYRFHHAKSDTFVDVAVIGDGADMGDKAGNKSMTTSKKYALLETFLLRTGDDPDETPSPQVQQAQSLGGQLRSWTQDKLDAVVEAGYAQHANYAKNALDKSALPVDAPISHIVSWMKYYKSERDQHKSAEDAAKFANNKYKGR